jgi:hypothetical protein
MLLEGREFSMDWMTRMRNNETELKELVDRLGATQGGSLCAQVERAYLMKSLSNNLADMRSFVEDCLCGRNSYEQSVMEYKVRVEFPLYSHLDSLSALSPDFVDWSSMEPRHAVGAPD